MKNKFGNLFSQSLKSVALSAMIVLVSLVHAQAQKGEAVVSTITATVTVTKINQKTRKVHIKTAEGKVYKLTASTDVQNLAQVKKGDLITVIYTEAMAYEVKKGGSAGASTTAAAATADPGEKPAGAVAQQTTVTVKITAIDTKTTAVTVKDPDGDEEIINVKDPAKLQGLKVGDTVVITYIEAFAIKMDPAVKK